LKFEQNICYKPIFDTADDRTYFLVKLPINVYFIEQKAQDKAQDKSIMEKAWVPKVSILFFIYNKLLTRIQKCDIIN